MRRNVALIGANLRRSHEAPLAARGASNIHGRTVRNVNEARRAVETFLRNYKEFLHVISL